MAKFVPVPCPHWTRYRIDGVLREAETGRRLAGLTVRAFDKERVEDDHLGDAVSDAEDRLEIHLTDQSFEDVVESQPDLCVLDSDGGALADTSREIRWNAGCEETFEIEIERRLLP